MTSPRDKDILSIDGWPGGINNRSRETENVTIDNRLRIPTGQFLRGAKNVDLTVQGKSLRRRGYTLADTGYCHSLWRHKNVPFALMVKDGYLCKISGPVPDVDNVTTVDWGRPMSYAQVNDRVYFSNGDTVGCIGFDGALRNWGIPVPLTPIASATPGLGLNAGDYQVALTYIDAYGEESGASEPVVVTVAQGAGISVALPPAPTEAVRTHIYATQANSEVFALWQPVSAATTSANLGAAGAGDGRVLETHHLAPPIAGHIVRYFNGRMYIAAKDVVMFTESLRYGLIRYSQSVYMMPDEVTLMEPTVDGLYIGYGNTIVFIAGDNPYEVGQKQSIARGAVEGTGTQVPGRFLGEPSIDYLPVWWSQQGGMVAGLQGGQVRQLTEDRLAVPTFGAGAILPREREGMMHLISSLRQPGENSFGASDSVVAEIRRNAMKT